MANMVGGEKVPEWTTEIISGDRIALKKKGIVIKTFYTNEDMKEWWSRRFPNLGPAPDPATILGHAIRHTW